MSSILFVIGCWVTQCICEKVDDIDDLANFDLIQKSFNGDLDMAHYKAAYALVLGHWEASPGGCWQTSLAYIAGDLGVIRWESNDN